LQNGHIQKHQAGLMYNKEKIIQVAEKKFGKDFQFRPGQLETIQDILTTYFDGKTDMYFLEAPTGSGKSLIAMIASAVLEDEGRQGYILTSDITLQKQYEKDLFYYKLGWGTIYGGDNYTCAVNGQPFFLGDCRLRDISYEQAEALPCFSECGYLTNRKRAIQSHVSLINYSYGLIQRNYVAANMQEQGRGEPFAKRDFVFCDEAHQITDIVQNHFSPRFNRLSIARLKNIILFQKQNGLRYPQYPESELEDLLDTFLDEEDNDILYAALKQMNSLLIQSAKANKTTMEIAKARYDKWQDIPREWQTAMNNIGFCSDILCKVTDFLEIIKQTGSGLMVKTANSEEATFNCLEESYMMDRHFHSKFGFKIFMSATMGNPKHFLKTIGAKNGRYNRLKSTFDYQDSPIYIYKGRRMGQRDIEKNTPWMVREVEKILRIHQNDSGIIHSGSYHLAKTLHAHLPKDLQKRVMLYDGTAGKISALSAFERENNMVLMGPSLLEGLDLKGEISRFQIFIKVPYPSLGNKFIKRKMETQPEWYRWKAEISISQGVGRSVRENGDWAKTYILDSCIYDLLKEDLSFTQEFRQRIIHIA
jgi:Rad3-related DNA helicase